LTILGLLRYNGCVRMQLLPLYAYTHAQSYVGADLDAKILFHPDIYDLRGDQR
jgi:hypothetical protein